MHTQVNTQTNDTGRSVANNAAKGGISLPAVSITGDNAVQRVITNNADGEEITDYDLDSIDYYVAVYLDEQINQLRVWSADAEDNAKIQAVLEAGPPGFGGAASTAKAGSPKSRKGKEPATEEAAFVPSSLAEKEKEKQIKVYLELIDHLAGEGGGKTALTGGHLLSEMKKKMAKVSG